MASASMVGHDDSGSKHRWGESKLVYMRKGHGKGAKANPGFDATQNTAGIQGRRESAITENTAGTQGRRESGIMGNSMEANGRTDTAAATSDGSSSLSRKQVSPNNADHDHDHDHGGVVPKESSAMPVVRGLANIETRITIKLDGYSKQEICELRRKLTSELEQVRGTFKKLEARELQMRGCSFSAGANTSYSASHFSGNDARNNGGKEVTSEVASGGAITPKEGRREAKPMRQLSISVVENNQAASDVAEKGKRTPKVNQYYRNSEFVLGKDKFPPSESKKAKSSGNKKVAQSKLYARETIHQGNDLSAQKFPNEVYKQCISLLSKLMKHKHGWVFNSPVDVEALALHDYHTIIKKPMDLGTVKSKLEKNLYNSPTSFAEDIRLTFSNAMTYNPEGHDVHIWAKQLLQLFEDRWKSIYGEQIENKMNSRFGSGQMPGVGANVKKLPFQDLKKNLKKSGFAGGPSPTKLKPVNYPTSRTPTGKKPKAKDPHKRDMTYEEKQKLSANLQNLPAERLELIVQIIKKRNPSLCQQDEEIEVDIDTFDTETLWELDRFVTNYKKSLSKNKKKALLAQQAKIAIEHGLARDKCPTVGIELPKKDKKVGEQGQEEVEIDDNMPPSNCPPVEIEKDSGGASRSSSSSSSSSDSGSSSSDSDSGSSSGSESDACAAQSPLSGSKMIPQD